MLKRFRNFLFAGVLVAVVCLGTTPGRAQNGPRTAGPLAAEDFNQFSWRWIGPMTFSGRITAFAVPRGQSQAYYVLTASGGLWKTVDGGIHFDPIFEKYGTQSMGWMAIAPSNQDVLYLGTGEPMHGRASTHGNGVWKSVDAGKTWTHVGLEKSYFIPMVVVDPRNPDIVFVAAEGKLYDNQMDCERGLFKTTDGGRTWTNLGPLKDRGVGDFVVDPRHPDVIVAAAYRHYRRAWTYDDRAAGNGLYKTVDGGKTWKRLTSGLFPDTLAVGRIGLAVFDRNPDILYARVDEEVNLGFPDREGAADFKTPGSGFFGGGSAANVFRPDFSFSRLASFRFNAEFVRQAGIQLTPVTAANDTDLVGKLNAIIRDEGFLAKNHVDIPRLISAARRSFGRDEATQATVSELEKLTKKPAPAPGSAEARGRSQVTNRLVLDIVYSGALADLQPTKRNGVIYRSEDFGETWKRMTEYRLPTGATSPEDARGEEVEGPRPAEDDAVRGGLYPDGQDAPAKGAPARPAGSAQVNQTEGGYYGRIVLDQNDDRVMYCGDTTTTVSRDGGRTFEPTGWDGDGKTHVDHRVVWVDPMNSSHLLSGNDGGVAETWDGGRHFSQKNGISAQQFYDVSVDNEQPYNVMGGTQDNGAWLGPSQNRNSYGMFGADWTYLPTGDAFYVVRDWWNPQYVYYESQFGSSSRMNLRTGEISQLAVRLTPEQVAAGEPPLRYQWNAPIVLSPHNPGIVYTASQYVWRSLSRGDRGTFVRISPDLTRADRDRLVAARKTNIQWATIYTFAESPKKPGLYWAGTDDGNVQMSPDGGVTWVNITSRFYDAAGKVKPGVKGDVIPYDRWVKRVVPSAFDENTAYVAFSGYRTHNEDKTWLFVTRDLGKSWTDISGGMNNPVFDVEEDPDNASVLYLGTDYGVFVTIDRGRTWTAFSSSMPPVPIRDLAIQKRDREMVIGTYGRGAYVCDIGPIKEFAPAIFDEAAHLFDLKTVVKWNRFQRRGDTLGEMAKADNPPVGTTVYYYLKADARNVKVTVRDIEGGSVQELTPSSGKGLQKAFWDLSRKPAPGAAPERRGPAGGRFGRANLVDPGVYKVTLTVDGKDVATKKVIVSPDPMFK